MNIKPVQHCRTTEGWSPVIVPSESNPDVGHVVLVNPYVSKREFVCDCLGFEYRGTCSHQEKALHKVCWWPLVTRPGIDQTPEQRHNKVCPYCGGPTKWEMVDADEET